MALKQDARPHSFNASLSRSHEAEDLPCWGQVYREAFPNMVTMVNHRQDGPHQRAGIDRSIILANAEQVLVDEKVRGRNRKTGKVYQDVLLEHYSMLERGVRGWVCRPLRAHFIAYAIAPLGICYLLNVHLLQRAWQQNGREWVRSFGHRRCRSERSGDVWTTVSVPVPVAALMAAIGQAATICFEPFEVAKACAALVAG